VVTLRTASSVRKADRAAAAAAAQAAQGVAAPAQPQGLFRHVLDAQLALAPAAVPRGVAQGMGPAASYLLLAICIRWAARRCDLLPLQPGGHAACPPLSRDAERSTG
jgi:hypothetical protein